MYVRIEQIERGVTDPRKCIYASSAFSRLSPGNSAEFNIKFLI